MNKTLVIMAAGIGSRFGGGIKQLEPVGPKGEIIMDYSIHDAISAGFNKIVFIIRHDIEKDFREVIGDRIEAICDPLGVKVAYAFQEISELSKYISKEALASYEKASDDELNKMVSLVINERSKPLGTGHAILSCDGIIDGAFAVINADDYYGKDGFIKAAEFLETGKYGLIGYMLSNTLSDNGGVTRGICTVSDSGELIGIDETKDIVKVTNNSAEGSSNESFDVAGNTVISAVSNGKAIDVNSLVSMNFWCYPLEFMDVLKEGFPLFLSNMTDPMKDEYLLPTIVDGLIKEGEKVTVIPTDGKWFGVTYKEDKESVVESFKNLYKEGAYREDLYSDLKILN